MFTDNKINFLNSCGFCGCKGYGFYGINEKIPLIRLIGLYNKHWGGRGDINPYDYTKDFDDWSLDKKRSIYNFLLSELNNKYVDLDDDEIESCLFFDPYKYDFNNKS